MFGVPNFIDALYSDFQVLSSQNVWKSKYFFIYLSKYSDLRIF